MARKLFRHFFSPKVAWNLLRTTATKVTWARLTYNKFVCPHLTCFSWHFLHRKTPTDAWVKHRGLSMASRCNSCFSSKETDSHLFFSCNLSQHFESRLLSLDGCSPSFPLSTTYIWTTIAYDGDASGRKCAAAIFFHTISVL